MYFYKYTIIIAKGHKALATLRNFYKNELIKHC